MVQVGALRNQTQDPGLSTLPFAERWNHVGNAATEQQILAARLALQTPESRGVFVATGKEYFSRTATSLKLKDERRSELIPPGRVRRASIAEAGSPLRHFSKNSSLSQEVQTELPRWKSISPGSQVQMLDRPNWIQRVERGLELNRSKRGMAQAMKANATVISEQRSRKGTDASIKEDPDEEGRQRRLRQMEQIRLRDAKDGMFDELHIPSLSTSLPNLMQSETLKSLNQFNKKVRSQAKRASYLYTKDIANPLASMSRGKILSKEEEDRLDKFWSWCKEQFGSLDKAFQAFDLNGNGQLSSVEFAEGCRARGYPGNPKIYKRVFFLMDADLDGVIGKPEFMGSKIKRSSTLNALEAQSMGTTQSSVNYDPFEDMNNAPRRSVLDVRRKVMIDDMFKQDPPVSQFIEFLFSSYASLKEAFRQIDINRNGLLSKSEFKDGLRILRVGKLNLLDKHLDNLYDRLDINGDGHISVDEMISETVDPMIQRLVKYLLDVRSDFHSKEEKDANMTRQQRLARVFAKIDDNTNNQIDRHEFVAALKRLRYLDWHVSDLFDRLDRDRSGQLSVEEFSAFLEKDHVQKRAKTKEESDGLSEFQMEDPAAQALTAFQEKFETGAYSLIFNSKLQKIGTRSGHTADLIRAGTIGQQAHQASQTGAIGHWTTDDSGGFAQKLERERDYCEEVRQKLKRPGGATRISDMRIHGQHTYGVSPIYSKDYLPLCTGLDHMDQRGDFARTMVTF
eukprot:gnl/MRDRNA2_/MRDRNA2_101812_c0_seq1.p1 gnl/MRDRNA2_/MRDRNA2_101812_c0~~gnl/MRDRNA2_/MRDRNA2_101812_c0_seq1.p1  ORF type:complete len:737 (-),score=143.80 gnl/MRDRNA2_/MRDRNA2_101812_c0_seq1:20-2230(-)